MSTLRPLGLKGRDPLHRRLSLASHATMPLDYEPAQQGHPNLQYVRHWRDQPGSSCVGHGVAQAYEVGKVRHGGSALEAVSRLHIYSNALEMQTPPGHKLQDEGTFIDYALTGLTGVGVCSERAFPPTPANVAKRPSGDAEIEGFEKATGGQFWQLHGGGGPGEKLWRECCWAIDTFGAVIVGKLVGNVYADHKGDTVIPAPGKGEVWLGGHCTVYVSHENYGLNLIELGSWAGWGYSRGVIGTDGTTRQIQSLARVSRNWLYSDWLMNCWVWVPDGVKS